MTNGHIEGILQFTDDRKDGELRDVQHPLRPVRGNITVPNTSTPNAGFANANNPGTPFTGQVSVRYDF